MRPFRRLACMFIRLYQCGLSPLLGTQCRFAPSCSHYAQDAVMRHGLARGGYLAVRRLLRCHPLGGSGYDPVPAITNCAQEKTKNAIFVFSPGAAQAAPLNGASFASPSSDPI